MADYKLNETGEQVEDLLSQVTTNQEAIQQLDTGKEDKQDGKSLSTNDYTDAEQEKLTALPTRAELTQEEQGLQANIDAEETRAKAAEAAELARAQAAEQTIQQGIDTEETRAKGIENGLRTDLDQHRNNGDIHVTTANKTAWNSKYDKPGSGIPQSDMDASVQAKLNAAGSADQAILNECAAREAADRTEAQTRAAADDALNLRLDGKANADHTHADKADKDTTYTKTEVDALLANKSSTNHTHADKQDVISDLATIRANAQAGAGNAQAINTEATARAEADQTERQARQSADSTLQDNIDTEAQARQSADTTLDGKIATEKSRAEGVEANLQTAINGKADSQHTHTKQDIIDFTHTHTKSDVTDFAHTHTKQDIIDFAHTHDDRYYTETEIDNEVQAINQAISVKASQADLTTHTGDTTVHITAAERTTWNAKQAAITDGAAVGLGYGTSSDNADVVARTAAITDFLLLKNMPVTVRFTTAVNVAGATLNINSTGAKPIFIEGVAMQPGVIKTGDIVTLIYDGTNWNIISKLTVATAASDLYVDMGLPSGVLWAKASIDITTNSGFQEVNGEVSPFEYECSFCSWGNTDMHNPTSTSAFTYDWGSTNDTEPYVSSPGAALTGNIASSQDAARANLGAPWRMPTTEEYAELFANIDYVQADGTTVIDAATTNKLVTVNGITGVYLKSKINGNLLFFACSGVGYGASWVDRGSVGYYWSSSLASQTNGRNLLFHSGGVNPQYYNFRFYGFSVRPVQ